jgi:glycosyltransferase involved in cell wall biosynthesis
MRPSFDSAARAAEKMRILIVTDEMEVGGTQRQIVHIATGLDPARFDVTVLYFRNRSAFVDELERAQVKVIRIDKRRSLDFAFLSRFRSTLRDGRFDVMHCFSLSGEVWGAVARASLWPGRRPALLSSVRGTYEWYGRWQWSVKRWVSLQSWRVIANSQMGAGYAREHMALPEGAIEVVYNGVGAMPVARAEHVDLRRGFNIGDDELLVLFVGRLVDHKDIGTLLRAMRRLRDARAKVKLLVAGEGPLRLEIEHQVAALGLADSVTLLGHRDDAAVLIAMADLLVLCSLREGLSNVILESMMAARPVVASRAGGNPELVEHELNGLLFDIGNEAALAAAIERLLCDAELRTRMGHAGRARAERLFSMGALISAMEVLYQGAACAAAGNGQVKREVSESV